ncbi:hypothetical protein PHYPSEUDO_000419 [Phytophthora pseudosyringae]|uniref:Uncharacterized protein n=1 Tax=Phytophthora pseudosyringae TaxID=221518 RepID=A0A8T1VYP0_9STRA|nr:hypothetical protein PHYPSEUDO_000419 [Phytophthora pseudosyringae]
MERKPSHVVTDARAWFLPSGGPPEIASGLQNEVAMFRQMCLNLQAEVSLLRSAPAAPDAGSNPQPPQHHHHQRPPPGMS